MRTILRAAKFAVIAVSALFHTTILQAQSETLSTGAFIVNMGATNPNTIANGLKPYGLVYDLVRNYHVPVRWVISQTKIKDGPDFTYNGVAYKGGTFIIPAEYRTAAVNNRILYWQGLGVVGASTTTALTLDVTYIIKAAPRWTLDAQNGTVAEAYLLNAGISNVAFPGAYNWKSPQTLGACDDFFVMPHAEPTWATHNNLLAWNRDYFGSIWAGCHAVSALENMVNPSSTAQQTNFLTVKDGSATLPLVNSVYANSNSMLLWTAHSDGTTPYTYRLPNDPISQFMGTIDAAFLNGSEKIYIPRQTGGVAKWNPGAKIITYDPSQANVSSVNPDLSNAAVVLVYGRAFDDPSRGYIMYQAGHSQNKGTAGDVAGQRAFFNFSFFQTTPKSPIVSGTGTTNGQQVSNGVALNYSVSASSPLPGITFTYQWTASCGGSFSTPTATSTSFTPAGTAGAQIVTCTVTDNCGRTSFISFPITILPPPVSPVVSNDNAVISGTCPPGTPVSIDVMSNDGPNTSTISFTSLNTGDASPANAGSWSNAGSVVTFIPDPNFNGTATITYTVTNTYSLSSTGTISVQVGNTDVNGCSVNSIYGPSEVSFSTLSGYVSSTGVTSATAGGTQLDDNEDAWSSTSNSGDYLDFGTAYTNNLILGIGSSQALRAKDTLILYWKKNQNTSIGTMSLQIGQSSSGPWTNTTVFTSNANPSVTVISKFAIPTSVSGITHIKISAGNVSTNAASATNVYADAIEFKYLSCISKAPYSVNDNVSVLEDQPTILSVMANDVDPQNLSLKIIGIPLAPAKGKVSINRDGTITYVSNTDISGTDYFQYEVANTEGYIDTAQVTVNIVDDACSAGQYKASSGAGTVTKIFQNGFSGTNAATANSTSSNFNDAYIRSSKTTTNYGASTSVQSGGTSSGSNIRRGIYKFNTSEIPATAVIQSAIFTGVATAVSSGFNYPVSVYALTRSWTEGTKSGSGTADGATWLNFATGAGNTWTTSGGDFNATALAATTINATGTYNWDITNQVQLWVGTPANNFGLIQKTDESASTSIYATFASKEYTTTTSSRPKLTVTYVVPTACGAIPNRAPLANPAFASTTSGVAVKTSPMSGCNDVDGNSLSITGVIQGANGNATYTGTTVTYTPNTSGTVPRTDLVSFIISDNAGSPLKDTAYFYITVNNAAPLAVKDISTINAGATATISVLNNDTDPEGTALGNPVISMQPMNGSASVSGSDIVYIPGTGFTGMDTLVYTITENTAASCSSSPLSDTALVVITVSNQSPAAADDNGTGLPCQDLRINLLSNDTDPEAGILTVGSISALSNPAAGTLTNNFDGTITFTPAMGFTGSFSFTYRVTDNGNSPISSSPATVTITIANASNTAPLAADDQAEASPQDAVVYYSVLDNDSDPENNSLMNPTITIQPLHGTATVLGNGLIAYTPNAGYYGKDTLTYEVCDYVLNPATCSGAAGLCSTARLFLTINSIGIDISGDLWQDIDGDATVNGPESTPNAGALYLNLVDESGNVLATTLVAPDGTYSFSNITPGLVYSLLLSSSQGTIGQPAPAANLPNGWTYTGVNYYGIPISGNPGLIGPMQFGYSSVPDINFGIEQVPTTDAHSTNISQPVTGQFITLNGGGNPPAFSGLDPEDCAGGCTLSNKTVYISSLPANAELWYNGSPITTTGNISHFDPSLMQIKITGATTGYSSVNFQYAYVDAAGFPDPTAANYSITWFIPLPVTGLTLSGLLTSNIVNLEWKTETELNSDFFIIERSTDGQTFVQIGMVAAAGNTDSRRYYQFADDISGITTDQVLFYRIRETDKDSKYIFSNTITVRRQAKTGLNIWPNPFDRLLNIKLTTERSMEATISLMNSRGQVVRKEKVNLKKGTNILSMQFENYLPAGMYLLRIDDDQGATIGIEKLLSRH